MFLFHCSLLPVQCLVFFHCFCIISYWILFHLVSDRHLQKLISAGFIVLSCYSLVYYPAFRFMYLQVCVILHSLYAHLFLLIFPCLLKILSNILCVLLEVHFSDILFSLFTFSVHTSIFFSYTYFLLHMT